MPELKLIALDADDLAVISAHLQDAVFKVGDIAYLPAERRFAALGNRFDWADALHDGGRPAEFVRRRSALRFERVLAAKVQGIDLAQGRVLSLLAIGFEPSAAGGPGRRRHPPVRNGGAIRLEVECIEAELKDLGACGTPSPGHSIPTTTSRTQDK